MITNSNYPTAHSRFCVIIHCPIPSLTPRNHIWILFSKCLLIFLLPIATNLVMLSLIILWISASYHCCLTSHCSLPFSQIMSFPLLENIQQCHSYQITTFLLFAPLTSYLIHHVTYEKHCLCIFIFSVFV